MRKASLRGGPLGAGAAEGPLRAVIGRHSAFVSKKGCPSARLGRGEGFADAPESFEPDLQIL
eukprot:16427532-Heterocapsa_arctica.AAC.1